MDLLDSKQAQGGKHSFAWNMRRLSDLLNRLPFKRQERRWTKRQRRASDLA